MVWAVWGITPIRMSRAFFLRSCNFQGHVSNVQPRPSRALNPSTRARVVDELARATPDEKWHLSETRDPELRSHRSSMIRWSCWFAQLETCMSPAVGAGSSRRTPPLRRPGPSCQPRARQQGFKRCDEASPHARPLPGWNAAPSEWRGRRTLTQAHSRHPQEASLSIPRGLRPKTQK